MSKVFDAKSPINFVIKKNVKSSGNYNLHRIISILCVVYMCFGASNNFYEYLKKLIIAKGASGMRIMVVDNNSK